MNVTHGEGVFYHTFLEYGPYAGEIGNRQNGAMISMTTEKAGCLRSGYAAGARPAVR